MALKTDPGDPHDSSVWNARRYDTSHHRSCVFGVAIGPYRAEAQERQSPRGLFDIDPSGNAVGQKVTSGPFDRLFVAEPKPNPDAKVMLSISQDPAQTPPQPRRTGLASLVRTTGADFKAFPRRRSTWVILGIGAGAAALAHPADDSLNARVVGSPAVGRFFAPGKYIGAFYVQAGAAAGLYVIGRYVLPPGRRRGGRIAPLHVRCSHHRHSRCCG